MMVEEGSTHPSGEALLEELKWVHGMIRANLKSVRDAASEIASGAPAEQVQAKIGEMAATNIVWRLRVDCMRYCYLVHSHHGLEDAYFFPFLCRANPAVRSVTDK